MHTERPEALQEENTHSRIRIIVDFMYPCLLIMMFVLNETLLEMPSHAKNITHLKADTRDSRVVCLSMRRCLQLCARFTYFNFFVIILGVGCPH